MRLAVLFGGRSAEHDVSLDSARAILEHLDPAKYELQLVGITRDGRWLDEEDSARLLAGKRPLRGGGLPFLPAGTDCVFPVLHGPGGEDGTLQGWLELCGVPFVGSGSLGSALAMDKALTKRVLRDAEIPVLSWSEVCEAEFRADPSATLDLLEKRRGLPAFVKPTALGSSVGISRVARREALEIALHEAFRYGEWAMVEPALDARELEIAVLDGDPAWASQPGEVRPDSWYDYSAKYLDDSAKLLVPAEQLNPRMAEHLQELALRAFRVLRLRGLARVDFLLDRRNGRPYLNEVNTLPGFTNISMYPKLVGLQGVSFGELCDRLIALAWRAPVEAPPPVPVFATVR